MKAEKGYKQTELGVIPEDWHCKTFGEVMKGFSSGQTPSRSVKKYFTGKIPWITSGELNYNVVADTIEKITDEAATKTHLRKIPVGTFLMAITGLEAEGTRGSCAITGVEATTNQSCMALYPNSGELTTEYLFQFYVKYGNWLAFKYCQGTKQQSYTGKIAKTLPIIFPPSVEEQNAITNTLNEADALIADLEKLITKKQNIKKAVIQKLLTQKRDWSSYSLGSICQILKGSGLSKSKVDTAGSYKCILYGELFTTYAETINDVKTFTNFTEGALSKLGDILLPGSTTTTGIDLAKASALMLNDVQLGGDVIVLRKRENVYEPIFLSHLLTHIKKFEIAQRTKGITIHHLHGKDLKDLVVELPKIQEQQKAVQILNDIDNEIEALQQQFSKYKLMKEGMMQDLLTGKVRLHNQ